MTKDIYLKNNLSPLFVKNDLVLVDNTVKLQALRNNLQVQLERYFEQSIVKERVLKEKDRYFLLSLLRNNAQLLHIPLSEELLNSLSVRVVRSRLFVSLDI